MIDVIIALEAELAGHCLPSGYRVTFCGVGKINAALRRIDEGEYGYCEVSGEPIGLKRLIARPVATMTVEAQEAHERREKISRDD